jgi:hypothetical protein
LDRPDLYHAGGTDLRDARARAAEVLHQPTGTLDDAGPAEAGMALWAVMHGVAALLLSGILPVALSDDPDQVARAAASSVLQRPTLYEMP